MCSGNMTWRASIDGNHEDLKLLERTFNDDPRVVYDPEYSKFFLESSRFDQLSGGDSDEVWRQAQEILQILSGMIEMNHGLFEGLRVAGLYKEDGETHVFDRPDPVRVHATSEARDALGLTNRDIFDEQEFFQLVESNGAVFELAMLWQRGDGWMNLCKILEHIEAQLGEKVHEIGWISKDERKNFRRTANDKKALGLDARHANPEISSSPPQPMAHSDARKLIRTVSIKWLKQERDDHREE